MPREVEHNLRLLYESAAALELARDPHRWRVVEWPWHAADDGAPVRFQLHSEDDGRWLEVILEPDGTWRFLPLPIDRV
jgi:hypothetical protein